MKGSRQLCFCVSLGWIQWKEIFDGMLFTEGEDRNKLNMIVAKFEAFCIRETNKFTNAFVFNSCDQKDG